MATIIFAFEAALIGLLLCHSFLLYKKILPINGMFGGMIRNLTLGCISLLFILVGLTVFYFLSVSFSYAIIWFYLIWLPSIFLVRACSSVEKVYDVIGAVTKRRMVLKFPGRGRIGTLTDYLCLIYFWLLATTIWIYFLYGQDFGFQYSAIWFVSGPLLFLLFRRSLTTAERIMLLLKKT